MSYGEGLFFVSLTIRIQPKILCVLPLRRMSSYTKTTCTEDYFNITNIFELTYSLGSGRAESTARLVLRMKLIMLISTAPLLSPASLYQLSLWDRAHLFSLLCFGLLYLFLQCALDLKTVMCDKGYSNMNVFKGLFIVQDNTFSFIEKK